MEDPELKDYPESEWDIHMAYKLPPDGRGGIGDDYEFMGWFVRKKGDVGAWIFVNEVYQP